MKNKTIFSVGGALMLAALASRSFTTDVNSFKELSAQALGVCVPDPNSVCISKETGQAFAGYREESVETEETID